MIPVFVLILNFHSLGGRYTLPSAECTLETVPFPQYPGAEAPSPAYAISPHRLVLRGPGTSRSLLRPKDKQLIPSRTGGSPCPSQAYSTTHPYATVLHHNPSFLEQALIPLRSPGSVGRRKDRYNQRRGREGPTKLVFPLVQFPALMLASLYLGWVGKNQVQTRHLSPSPITTLFLAALCLFLEGTQDLVGPKQMEHLSHKGRKQRSMHIQNSKLIPTGKAFDYQNGLVTAAAQTSGIFVQEPGILGTGHVL